MFGVTMRTGFIHQSTDLDSASFVHIRLHHLARRYRHGYILVPAVRLNRGLAGLRVRFFSQLDAERRARGRSFKTTQIRGTGTRATHSPVSLLQAVK